jgi:CRISPR/Cas system Type II protein with McrA/HNH and RuvC-like nuclease domain
MGNILFIKKNKIEPSINKPLAIKLPINKSLIRIGSMESDTTPIFSISTSDSNPSTVFSNSNLHKEHVRYSLDNSREQILILLKEYKQFIDDLFEPDYLNEDKCFNLTAEIYNKKSDYVAKIIALKNNISAYEDINSNVDTKVYKKQLDDITCIFTSNIFLLKDMKKIKFDNILLKCGSLKELLNKI